MATSRTTNARSGGWRWQCADVACLNAGGKRGHPLRQGTGGPKADTGTKTCIWISEAIEEAQTKQAEQGDPVAREQCNRCR